MDEPNMELVEARQEADDLRQRLANTELKLERALKAQADYQDRERARRELVAVMERAHERVSRIRRMGHDDAGRHWTVVKEAASDLAALVREQGDGFGELGLEPHAVALDEFSARGDVADNVELHSRITDLERLSGAALLAARLVAPAWAATQD